MKIFNKLSWILFWGTLWGFSEVVLGKGLSDVDHASALLAIIAVILLLCARLQLNKPGSSAVIGLITILFKLINAAPFHCHLMGIAMIAMSFEAIAFLLMKKDDKSIFSMFSTSVLSTYLGHTTFALILTYIVKYKYWAQVGWPKVQNHIFVDGSLSAIGLLLLIPVIYFATRKNIDFLPSYPKVSQVIPVFLSALLWVAVQ